jgi:hypothetical protein
MLDSASRLGFRRRSGETRIARKSARQRAALDKLQTPACTIDVQSNGTMSSTGNGNNLTSTVAVFPWLISSSPPFYTQNQVFIYLD